MGQYTKQTVANGQTITSSWGNDVQTQFEKVVGVANNEITEIRAILRDIDTRNVQINRGTDGKISTITVRDNTTVILTYTLNRTNGRLSSVVETGGGKTVIYTLNREADSIITSITKTVV